MEVIVSFFVCVLFVYFLIGIGCIVFKDLNENVYTKISVGFVEGLFLLIALVRIGDVIIKNFRESFLISFICIIGLLVNCIGDSSAILKSLLDKKLIKQYLICVMLGLLFLIISFFAENISPPESYGVWTGICSAHTGRYVNLAYDIYLRNRIPVVGQNYGGSLVTAIYLLTGLDRGYFVYAYLVSFSKAVLAFFTIGLFERYGIETRKCVLYTLCIMIAGTALSLSPVIIMDIGWPLYRVGYMENSVSVISLIIISEKFLNGLFDDKYQIRVSDFVFAAVAGISWNIIGGYIIFFIISVVFFCVIASFGAKLLKKMKASKADGFALCCKKSEVIFITVLISFFGVGTIFGGVFTNPDRYDELDFEGMIDARGDDFNFGILPEYYYMVAQSNGPELVSNEIFLNYGNILTGNTKDYYPEGLFDEKDVEWFAIETAFFDMIRILFWPIFGCLLLVSFTVKKEYSLQKLNCFPILSFVYIAVGIGLAYGIMYGAKWWLTRLMYYGAYTGLISLFLCLGKQKNDKWHLLVKSLIIFAMSFGSIYFFVQKMIFWNNIYGSIKNIIMAMIMTFNLSTSIFYYG